MFAILRVEKLKTLGNIHASAAHTMRARETPNADPARRDENVVLVGSGDPAQDIRALVPEKRRKNAVLAVECLLTASPEFFQGKTLDSVLSWANDSVACMQEFWGQSNVVAAVLHMDEHTPHIHLYAVPLKDGRLCCREFLGGREKMRRLQDTYAEAMGKHGLRRGIRKSRATHQEVRRWYQGISSPRIRTQQVQDLEVVRRRRFGLPQTERVRIEVPDPDDVAACQAAAGSAAAAHKRALEYRDTAAHYERLYLAAARDIPLETVATKLGLKRDRKDPKKWKKQDADAVVQIKDNQFFDPVRRRRGTGALALVRHVLGVNFIEAVAWLKGHFGADAAVDAVQRCKAFAQYVVSAASVNHQAQAQAQRPEQPAEQPAQAQAQAQRPEDDPSPTLGL